MQLCEIVLSKQNMLQYFHFVLNIEKKMFNTKSEIVTIVTS